MADINEAQAASSVDYHDRAEYSADGLYRWRFERRWAEGRALCWVGLNPSTGDATGRPRPTLRKVVALARAEGAGAVIVVNLFAWRATEPADLARAAREHDIVGGLNDQTIASASEGALLTLAAWGGRGSLLDRGTIITRRLHNPMCLGLTVSGQPRHPLYVPGCTALTPYAPSH